MGAAAPSPAPPDGPDAYPRLDEPRALLHFALRSDDNVEVGILGGDIVVRRAGWLARALRESCPRRVPEVVRVADRRLPVAVAAAHQTGATAHTASALHRV